MAMFALLHEKIRQGLKELGFIEPTDIQTAAIPEILKGRHALLIAPTGIGKTEAAMLPIFSRFLEAEKKKGVTILYITPLRALNRDLMQRLEWWGDKLGIKIAVRHGDTKQSERRKQTLKPPDMFITTPETLQALLTGKVLRRHLKDVEYVVVDEIHELAESKRGAQLSTALERLYAITNREFQRIGISATIGNPEEIANFLVWHKKVNIIKTTNPKAMKIQVEYPEPKREDRYISAKILSSISVASRVRRIVELVKAHNRVLIFVNTRETAEAIASRFKILEEPIGIHHSSLSQEVRVDTEDEFKMGKLKALIATSSLELGIDIGSVDLVIQYKSPRQVLRLVQRVGRAGHSHKKESKGVVIATDSDDTLESLVITCRSLDGKVESVKPWEKPFDVLAHQLVGLAFEYRKVKKEHALLLFRRSYPFRELEEEELDETLRLLSQLRILWVDDDYFGRTRRSLEYYYGNLSTIPDERKFFVRNFATGTMVGVLHERFVASYAEPGSRIIFKGSPWSVLSITEDEITVEPLDRVEGSIPSWVGEEIPVPFEVAQDVAELMESVLKEDIKALDSFPCTEYTKRQAISKIRHHKRKGIPIATKNRLVLERFNSFAVIHAPFGHRVNQTLGRVYSMVLTSLLGSNITFRGDAYRIILQAPFNFKMDTLEQLFRVSPDFIQPILISNLRRTSLFRWKFSQVAKRFGVISKEFSYANIRKMDRVINAYRDTLVYNETLKEIFRDNLNVKKAKEVIEKIVLGEIEVELISLKEPSPIAELGFRNYGEVVVPEKAERLIAKAVKKRISDRRVELFCLYCGKWHESFMMKSIMEDIKCGKCSARMLAVLKGRDNRELMKLYRKFKRGEELSQEEKRRVKSMQTSASLFLSYGKKAVVAQAGIGIGPDVAKRVLSRARIGDEDSLYREIVKEERNYARTRVFWD